MAMAAAAGAPHDRMMVRPFFIACGAVALCIQMQTGWSEEAPPVAGNYTTRSFVYGKYFEPSVDPRSPNDYSAQTYYIFSPRNIPAGTKLPVMMQIHGGGFTSGAATKEVTPEIAAFLDNGFHYVSVGYRLVATKYYYPVAEQSPEMTGGNIEEEFIWAGPAAPPHAAVNPAPSGFLQLDTGGPLGGGPMYLSDYKVHAGRTEFNTKCSYDAAQALEHLITHADQLQLDMHKLLLTGSSAGGGEIHYLTWVYHGFHGNAARYTPRGMVYTMAQLDYPVQNMLDKVWSHWADNLGAETPLSTMLKFADCGMIIGNPWCEGANFVQAPWLCNATWHQASLARYCSTRAAFEAATLGDLVKTQVFPQLSAQDAGIATLWYNTVNMQRHAPKPFHLYIANWLNSTAGMEVVHNALYGRLYADFAAKAGINFTTCE